MTLVLLIQLFLCLMWVLGIKFTILQRMLPDNGVRDYFCLVVLNDSLLSNHWKGDYWNVPLQQTVTLLLVVKFF